MASAEFERLWSDPSHWTPPGIYKCVADPRLIVPKRRRWAGWTLNFAHRGAWLVLLGMVVIAAGPAVGLLVLRRPDPGVILLGIGGSILVIIALSAWESERRR
ncbi:MAG: DUF5808 domain-containing protein [Gemmatimonadales bacterium]